MSTDETKWTEIQQTIVNLDLSIDIFIEQVRQAHTGLQERTVRSNGQKVALIQKSLRDLYSSLTQIQTRLVNQAAGPTPGYVEPVDAKGNPIDDITTKVPFFNEDKSAEEREIQQRKKSGLSGGF